MKIQYASDLHLEFKENANWLKENPLIPVGDVLLLAGDIGYLDTNLYSTHSFWDWAADNFQQVFVIPGNHELYNGFDINQLKNGWTQSIRKNINVYYNCVIPLTSQTDLIMSTLWSHVPVDNEVVTENCVMDFRNIKDGKLGLSVKRFNEEHNHCMNFIKNSVKKSSAENIVIATHHLPSYDLVPDEFKDSLIGGAFASEHKRFIGKSRINHWLYGHSHRNVNETIGKTKCFSNQLGYVFNGEHKTFNRSAVISVP